MTIQLGSAVSVVICTRNRGVEIVPGLHSILASSYAPSEIIIIDQSHDGSTEAAVAPFRSDARVRYIRTATRGLDRARNLGWQSARSEIIAMTDDDCVVPIDWLERIVAAFASSPQLGMLYTTVYAAEHDPSKGSIPAIVFTENQLLRTIVDWRQAGRQAPGLGASMAFRRSVAAAIGGFDPLLGVGELLKSGGELDFTLRTLLHGFHLMCCADNSVVHYGFRTWPEARDLYYGYAYGPMASYAKLARSGHRQFYGYAAQDFWKDVIVQGVSQILQVQKPTVRGRILGMSRGFAHGLRLPIRPGTNVFEDVVATHGNVVKSEDNAHVAAQADSD